MHIDDNKISGRFVSVSSPVLHFKLIRRGVIAAGFPRSPSRYYCGSLRTLGTYYRRAAGLITRRWNVSGCGVGGQSALVRKQ